MIDVVSITRAAKLRQRRAPSMPAQPVFAPEPPVQDALFPIQTPVMAPAAPRGMPSALSVLMKRHDRLNERHIAGH